MSRAEPDLVRAVHREVGERLHTEQQRRISLGEREYDGVALQQFARKLIADVIRERAAAAMARGEAPLDPEIETELAEGVHARIFGAGRLQALLDDPTIENIDINGCDDVWVTRAGSAQHEQVDPVAATDDELIELVQTLASYAGLNPRPWDDANPMLILRLQGGERLAATMKVSARPLVSIRRNRFQKVELGDLVGLGSMSEEVADFLSCLVKARHNLMIAGGTRSGKTTLLRAMAAEIDPGERIITIESALELALADDKERHPNSGAVEERLPNSEGGGAVSMTQLVRMTLRQNPDRVIVGEVLGPEVVDMLNAMGQGNDGSMSTIHARSSRQVFDRIATYAIQAAERLPHEASYQLIAGGLDYVIYISRDPSTGERRLESILEVNGYDNGVQASEIFEPGPERHAVFSGTLPAEMGRLEAAGWRPPHRPGMGVERQW